MKIRKLRTKKFYDIASTLKVFGMDKHYIYNTAILITTVKKFYQKNPKFAIYDSILKTTIENFQIYFILHQGPML